MTVRPARGDRGDLFDATCPTRHLLDRVGSKWSVMLVLTLHAAAPIGDAEPGFAELRFAELRRRAPGISQKMLTASLRSLERDGLVARRVEPTTPPRVHYRLTRLGASLVPALLALRDWAETNMPRVDDNGAAYDGRLASRG
ncbi:winged helix-turn-helix transcriptional regulator [Schumannella soli]|uniref:winged helix-turn-helix transcriptional regulator n=1 Tax=Schumannella soli TaxID=2590779 RepID=UPI002101EC85|nr:helix-turn-helix domain-containing protein [Schumannella soli]